MKWLRGECVATGIEREEISESKEGVCEEEGKKTGTQEKWEG
jgi:hypothetical protein